jgi:hypothetical protein
MLRYAEGGNWAPGIDAIAIGTPYAVRHHYWFNVLQGPTWIGVDSVARIDSIAFYFSADRARATLYRLPLRRARLGRRGARWELAAVRAYIAINSSERRVA